MRARTVALVGSSMVVLAVVGSGLASAQEDPPPCDPGQVSTEETPCTAVVVPTETVTPAPDPDPTETVTPVPEPTETPEVPEPKPDVDIDPDVEIEPGLHPVIDVIAIVSPHTCARVTIDTTTRKLLDVDVFVPCPAKASTKPAPGPNRVIVIERVAPKPKQVHSDLPVTG